MNRPLEPGFEQSDDQLDIESGGELTAHNQPTEQGLDRAGEATVIDSDGQEPSLSNSTAFDEGKIVPPSENNKKNRRRARRKAARKKRAKRRLRKTQTTIVPIPNPISGSDGQPVTRRSGYFGRVSFVLMVVIPAMLVGYYFYAIASPQYQSEIRFAVRGTNSSPLDALSLTTLVGNSTQASDSYIVVEYLRSLQVIVDVKEKSGIDLVDFYSKDGIDAVYRLDRDVSTEEFASYWEWFIDASHDSTTGIAAFRVNAFSGEDAFAISSAVMDAARELVNDLSRDVQQQLIETAKEEVSRTEARLVAVRKDIRDFRDREQLLNPNLDAESGQKLIQGLQEELIQLNARRSALNAQVSDQSPAVRVLDRQIAAIRSELDQQLQNIGSGDQTDQPRGRNLSDIYSDYADLTLEQEFAEKAYTSALSSLESSQAEARKQQRYFALVVPPTRPTVAFYPLRSLNSLIALICFLVVWLVFYFVVQAIRDHSV